MSDAARIPAAILWHEGMLLAPQHFQQMARRHEDLLHYHMQQASPFHWGVVHCDIDQVLLAGGIFRVSRLEAIMPDGLLVQYGGAESLQIPLELHADRIKRTGVTAYLAVASQRGDGDAEARGTLARYVQHEGAPIADEATGQGELRIPRQVPRLHVQIWDTPPDKFVALPLGRIVFKDEAFALSSAFAPPVLAVRPGSPIGAICAEVARRVREKAMFLAERARSPAIATRGALVGDNQRQVQALVAGLPALEVLVASGGAHPFQLYHSLAALAGQVASLGSGLVPPPFRAYEHGNPLPGFREMAEFVIRVLDTVREAYVVVPFGFQQATFSLTLQPNWASDWLLVGVRPRNGQNDAEVAAWMEECVIASVSQIGGLRERRIRGAARRRLDAEAVSDLVAPRGVLLYAVQSGQNFVVPNEGLLVHNPADTQGERAPSEMVLFVPTQGGLGSGPAGQGAAGQGAAGQGAGGMRQNGAGAGIMRRPAAPGGRA